MNDYANVWDDEVEETSTWTCERSYRFQEGGHVHLVRCGTENDADATRCDFCGKRRYPSLTNRRLRDIYMIPSGATHRPYN